MATATARARTIPAGFLHFMTTPLKAGVAGAGVFGGFHGRKEAGQPGREVGRELSGALAGQPADQGGDGSRVVSEAVAGAGDGAEVGVAEGGFVEGAGVGDGDDLVGLAVDQQERAGGDAGGGLEGRQLGEPAAPRLRVGREVVVADAADIQKVQPRVRYAQPPLGPRA